MGSRDIAILVYVGILVGIQYYSSISKVSIAKVSARFALKLGVAIEGMFLDYSLCHAVNAAVVSQNGKNIKDSSNVTIIITIQAHKKN